MYLLAPYKLRKEVQRGEQQRADHQLGSDLQRHQLSSVLQVVGAR